jgi:DNA-directed RNA polymerase subunit beta'
MALELFEPFIVKRLKDLGYVYTIRSAKKMIQRQAAEVWDVLEEVIKGHPVLLNRAPTLHRLGIQAFEPVLIEGKAIRIHPLVCTAFNADFDGDQMAVYVPLSVEAQLEAKLLMMAPDNIFLPSSGKPVAVPSKDMILGLYYLMHDPLDVSETASKAIPVYKNTEEVLLALSVGDKERVNQKSTTVKGENIVNNRRGIHIHQLIKLRTKNGIIDTTPGRVIFNTIVPEELGFQNYSLPKSRLGNLVLDCYKKVGLEKTVKFLDDMKHLGFVEATLSGISMAVSDACVPENKQKVLEESYKKVEIVKQQFEEGIITDGERHSRIITIWTEATNSISNDYFIY